MYVENFIILKQIVLPQSNVPVKYERLRDSPSTEMELQLEIKYNLPNDDGMCTEIKQIFSHFQYQYALSAVIHVFWLFPFSSIAFISNIPSKNSTRIIYYQCTVCDRSFAFYVYTMHGTGI